EPACHTTLTAHAHGPRSWPERAPRSAAGRNPFIPPESSNTRIRHQNSEFSPAHAGAQDTSPHRQDPRKDGTTTADGGAVLSMATLAEGLAGGKLGPAHRSNRPRLRRSMGTSGD